MQGGDETLRETGRLYIRLLGVQDAGVGAAKPREGAGMLVIIHVGQTDGKALYSSCEDVLQDLWGGARGWQAASRTCIYIILSFDNSIHAICSDSFYNLITKLFRTTNPKLFRSNSSLSKDRANPVFFYIFEFNPTFPM